MRRRWRQLMIRHSASQDFVDLAVLPSQADEEADLADIGGPVVVESGRLDLEELSRDSDGEISSYFVHTSRLQSHRDYATGLRDDIISAKRVPGSRECVFVLLRHGDRYAWSVW